MCRETKRCAAARQPGGFNIDYLRLQTGSRCRHWGFAGDAARLCERTEGHRAAIVDRTDGDIVRRQVRGFDAANDETRSYTSHDRGGGFCPKGETRLRTGRADPEAAVENSHQIDTIRKRAKGEVEVRYIGKVTKRAARPWHQKTTRPLRIGASLGHFKITAGTLKWPCVILRH